MENQFNNQPDTTADSSPSLSDEWISVKEATKRLHDAGLPRNDRSVRRYCKRGDLLCHQSDNEQHQAEWKVSVESLNLYIDQEYDLGRGQGRTQSDVSGNDQQVNETQSVSGMHGQTQTQPDMTVAQQVLGTDADSDGHDQVSPRLSGEEKYIQQLERENELLREQLKVKDGQISDSSERDRETNILMKGLQDRLPALEAPRTREYHQTAGDNYD